MPQRGRAGVWFGVALGLGVAFGVGFAWKGGAFGPRKVKTASSQRADRGLPAPKTEVAALARRVAEGDNEAVSKLRDRLARARPEGTPRLSPEEGFELVGAVVDLRRGYGRASASGKVAMMESAGKILDLFGAEPAPAEWSEALAPSHDMFTSAMADAALDVRVAALAQVGRLWSFAPDRSLTPAEENALAAWKAGLYAQARRLLADPTPKGRAAAVMCLAALPLDDKAAPAVNLTKDDDWQVRLQVLAGFSGRPDVLTNEEILPLLHDSQDELAELAGTVLKARGLTRDQIGLAKMLVHPKPGVRTSAIPLLLQRDDIDPTVWLLFLSRDKDETVRLQAISAMTGRPTPETRRRLEEMAGHDPSAPVREAARKLLPASEATVSLPPLPGSPSLNPRAN